MMTNSLIVKFPGQKTWCGLNSLETARAHPDTIVEVRDTTICRYKASHGFGQSLGKMPLRDARAKFC